MANKTLNQVLRYGVPVLAVAVAFALKLLLSRVIEEESPFLVFFIAVLVSAWYGGLGPGLLATVLAAVLADYFFLTPLYSFLGRTFGQNLRLGLFVVEGTLISVLVARLHTATYRAERSKQHAEASLLEANFAKEQAEQNRQQADANAVEAKQRQHELYASEERYRSLVDGIHDYAILRLDRDGNVTSWNAGAVNLVGYEADEITGQHFSRFFTKEDKAANRPAEELQIANHEGHYEAEGSKVRKDNSQFLANVVVASLKDADGTLRGYSAVMRDVTESKRAEQALKVSEERFRSLVTATAQIIWVTDAQGFIREDMAAWRDFTGQKPEEIKGHKWLDAVHPEDRDRTAQMWQQAVETRCMYDTEYRIRSQSGEYRFFAARGVPVLEADGSIREWIGICIDINERKQAEEKRAVLQRMEAERGQLQQEIIRMQHDRLEELSTPLIPLSSDVLVMPLIGTIDHERAARVLDTLSNGIARRSSARIAIIDITGVSNIDTHVAATLIQAAQMVRLLGAEVILTGIRAPVAQTLVSLGIELTNLTTRSTLQDGIDHANKSRK